MTELTILDEDRSLPATTDKELAEGRQYRFDHFSIPVVLGTCPLAKMIPAPVTASRISTYRLWMADDSGRQT